MRDGDRNPDRERDRDRDAGQASMGTTGTSRTAGAALAGDTEQSLGGPGIAGSRGTGGEKERPGTPGDAMPIAVEGRDAVGGEIGEDRLGGDVGDVGRGTDEATGRGNRPAERGAGAPATPAPGEDGT